MKTKILLIILLLPYFVFSQSGRLKYADKKFDNFEYAEAIEGYLDVLERSKDSLLVAENIAISYEYVGDAEKAYLWYRTLHRADKSTKKSLLRLAHYARVNKQYEKSNEYLTICEEKFGNDPSLSKLYISSSEIAELEKSNSEFDLKGEFLDLPSSEIGSSFYSDSKILITSSQRKKAAINRTYGGTGDYFYNLYETDVNEDGSINGKLTLVKGDVNTQFHDGLGSYDKENNYLYFTRDNYLKGEGKGYDANQVMHLKIYRGKVNDKDGKLSITNVEELPFNNNSYSCSHPSISKDGKRLFFSSDMPGGKGGVDIYYVDIDEGKFGTPVNMGDEINTPFDEVFPYYKQEEDELYFSSNGHKGLGGLDIFIARMDSKGVVRTVKNLGAPINSSYDDFSFSNNGGNTLGYFSSNRAEVDNVHYFLQDKPVVIKGLITDEHTGQGVPNMTVNVYDEAGNLIGVGETDSNGYYEAFIPHEEGNVKVVIEGDGYVSSEDIVEITADKKVYNRDYQVVPSMHYDLLVLVQDDKTMESIADVDYSFSIGEKEYVGQTNSEGRFEESLPDIYGIGSVLELEFKLEKEGYISNSILKTETLTDSRKVELVLNLNKFEEGESDLANILNLDPVLFDLNSSYFNRPDSRNEMQKVVKIMNANPSMKIEIRGHTDQRGSAQYNMFLSERRAKRAYDYLIANGISASRIVSVEWFGLEQPRVSQEEIDKASSEEEKESLYQLNRRTQFIVVSMGK